MNAPIVLRGHKAIAAHLGIRTREVQHLHRHRRAPTFVLDGGVVMATAAGLDDWKALRDLPATQQGER